MIGFGWLRCWWNRELPKLGLENPPAPVGERPNPPPAPPAPDICYAHDQRCRGNK